MPLTGYPILQIALDFLDLPRALAVAEEALKVALTGSRLALHLSRVRGLEVVRE